MRAIERMIIEIKEELGYNMAVYITPVDRIPNAIMVYTTTRINDRIETLDFCFRDVTSDIPLHDRIKEEIINNFNVAFLGGINEII